MIIEMTWTRIFLAILFLVLMRFCWVLFRPGRGNNGWDAISKGEVVGHLRDKPVFLERLSFLSWGVKYVFHKKEDT